jgi:geranylgeranyl reductase
MTTMYDVVVVGGGPSGATAAHELARRGHSVALLDRGGRVKPCGGAIPPQAIADFEIPDHLIVARVNTARMVSPTRKSVDIPVGEGFVGMVDRGPFDEWLRNRAASAGAVRITGILEDLTRDSDGRHLLTYRSGESRSGEVASVKCRVVVGADGALSLVARRTIPVAARAARHVFAYHEVVTSPSEESDVFRAQRADVYYDARLSPDFYAWIFPHGAVTSVGTGSMQQGFKQREAVARLRAESGLDACHTVRREGAPIPLRPLDWWDNGRDSVVCGDAAGVVAPASGEGIFYAMTSGRFAAEAVHQAIVTGNSAKLAWARRKFLWKHGIVFGVLGVMQDYYYSSDRRRESFVAICRDTDVQRLAFDGYKRKKLVFGKPIAHVRIFFKNLGHLFGVLAPA